MKTNYIGFDYSGGKSNIDLKTGIHYGVISINEVSQAWFMTKNSRRYVVAACGFVEL